jgi:hypothetical protein
MPIVSRIKINPFVKIMVYLDSLFGATIESKKDAKSEFRGN